MGDGTTAKISRQRQVNTYGVMWHASGVMVKLAQEDPRGSTWKCMASLTFAAFALEAYLNQVGEDAFNCWNDIERPLSPIAKLNLLSEEFEALPDYGKRPYQTIKALYKFRNDIAHGRPETLSDERIVTMPADVIDAAMGELLEPEWQRFCTEANTLRIREDVERVIRDLHERSGSEDRVFSLGMQLGSTHVHDGRSGT